MSGRVRPTVSDPLVPSRVSDPLVPTRWFCPTGSDPRVPTHWFSIPWIYATRSSGFDWSPPGDETRSAEGLGGPRPSSLGLALTIRIWGPGQSPAGAQRRTKATHDPALYREVHPVQSKAT